MKPLESLQARERELNPGPSSLSGIASRFGWKPKGVTFLRPIKQSEKRQLNEEITDLIGKRLREWGIIG